MDMAAVVLLQWLALYLFILFFLSFFFFLFLLLFPYPTPPYFPWTPQLIGDHEAGRSENVRVTLAASPWTERATKKKKNNKINIK